MTGESFIDVDFCQQAKNGQVMAGDVFLSRKIKAEGRVISVLSDGLGSGVKAAVLANLTATMALRYTMAFVDVRRSAKTIMDTLPVCEVRKISYSTFTIVDLDEDGKTRVIEHGNPPLMLLRGQTPIPIERTSLTLEAWKDRVIHYSEFDTQLGDRIVFYSDGVSQSGLGRAGLPLGWGADRVTNFLQRGIAAENEISARELSHRLVAEALVNDGQAAKDDISCGVIYYRRPRRLLILTGPPFSRERDGELAELVQTFDGRKAICGGTTAGIVSRLLGRNVTMDLAELVPEIPPAAAMEGVDLVTEGTVTLGKVSEILEGGNAGEMARKNPATDLISLMLQSDIVEFVVGTRINEAHQDPNVPVELDLRRNIVRKIARLLETRYLKEAPVRFI
ncbi:MAG TPA: SpoIIE family protein phosphatase [Candidatus Acidoferrales bacterium]|nr:SpoIIE family protein phosphatase [Candidatus Acidoferrales bacterium]